MDTFDDIATARLLDILHKNNNSGPVDVSTEDCLEAEQLILNTKCNINARHRETNLTPLMLCAQRARSEDNGCLKLMKLILTHRKDDLEINLVDDDNVCALNWAFGFHLSNSINHAAVRLLVQDERLEFSQLDNDGYNPLHRLITELGRDVSDAIDILRKFMSHPNIDNCVRTLSSKQLSAMDIFLMNTTLNCYDLDLVEKGREIFELLVQNRVLVRASGKTMALAGTYACPSVFDILLRHGGKINDSLDEESTMHAIIQKNSLTKVKHAMELKPNLEIEWNYLTPEMLCNLYGCNPKISQLLTAKKIKHQNPNKKAKTIGAQSICNKWYVFNDFTCSKIKIVPETRTLTNESAIFAVKHCAFFLTKYKSEVSEIRNAIEAFFKDMNHAIAGSKIGHMKYKLSLSGSMGDGTKIHLPDEFDYVCTFSNILNIETFKVLPDENSVWRRYCDDNGRMLIRDVAQTFYSFVAKYCHNFNSQLRNTDKKSGISQCLFQYMDKISKLRLIWKGEAFDGLAINVDVVPAFSRPSDDVFNLGARLLRIVVIPKASRHQHLTLGYFYKFQRSFRDAETNIIQHLPQPIRQGFIIAKAIRLATICVPGIDFKVLCIVEDLCIEDYVTSHILKNCLLVLLQMLRHIEIDKKINTVLHRCKFVWADRIYHVLFQGLVQKTLRNWYDLIDSPPLDNPLCDCRYCLYERVCCQKRKVRLALVTQIRTWLRDNIHALHGARHCTCQYPLWDACPRVGNFDDLDACRGTTKATKIMEMLLTEGWLYCEHCNDFMRDIVTPHVIKVFYDNLTRRLAEEEYEKYFSEDSVYEKLTGAEQIWKRGHFKNFLKLI